MDLIFGFWGNTHFTTWGAMTLHGPHQVAKQSRTMRLSFSPSAVSKSALLWVSLACVLIVGGSKSLLGRAAKDTILLGRMRENLRREVVNSLLAHCCGKVSSTVVVDWGIKSGRLRCRP